METAVKASVGGSEYRPDIDGLRAIAVLIVVFYHFGVQTFSGGFVGVDVFFVISGFLITRLILNTEAAGSFTFGNFYLRRARRLLPALLFTIFISFFLGTLFFTPTQLARLGGSTLHGIFSLSNFFFWNESGYFDADSFTKPLLHLWSLSVEEQFYLVWPLFLVLLCKIPFSRIVTPLIFICLGVMSWAFAEWVLRIDPSAAFYLLPSRIVEFCLGAIMVWVVRLKIHGWLAAWLHEAALLVGLIMIAYATITFSKDTPFPGTNALMPCVGTSLALFGGKSRNLGSLLRSRPVVFTGLISYSLYLCHWPIFVFYTYLIDSVYLSRVEVFALTTFSFVVATFMYYFVEQPFRFAKLGTDTTLSSTRFALTCALLCLALAYASANSWATGGWYWRFGNPAEVEELFDLNRLRAETIDYQRQFVHGYTFGSEQTRVLVVGDSHARDISNGLHLALAKREYEVRMLHLDDVCLREIGADVAMTEQVNVQKTGECARQIESYRTSKKSAQADIIIYSANLSSETAESLHRFVQLARDTSLNDQIELVLMDRAVNYGTLHNKAIWHYRDGVSALDLNSHAATIDTKPFLLEAIKKNFAENPAFDDVLIVSKRRYQCSDIACDFFADDGSLAIWDSSHWTLSGAKQFMKKFADDYPELFNR